MTPDAERPFSQDSPAEHIHQLLEYLEAERTEQHCFRGQNGYFAQSIPAALRGRVTGASEDGAWLELDTSDIGFDTPLRQRAQYSFRELMMMVWGRGVGELLAQQYGLRSDAYDITSEPSIAGFFATRVYPHYRTVGAEYEGKLGVIYRFRIGTQSPPPLKVMENTLLSLYAVHEDSGTKWWFHDVRSIRKRVIKGELRSPEAIQRYLESVFPDGWTSTELLRPAAYVPYPFIEAAFTERAREMDLTGIPEMIRSSRAFRQVGGLYFSPSMHTAFIPGRIQVEQNEGHHWRAIPGTAETLGAQKVFNINLNPFVEKFFFRHDPARLVGDDRDVERLWPSEHEDEILKILVVIARERLGGYLKEANTEPLDFENGIIDPGYLSTSARP